MRAAASDVIEYRRLLIERVKRQFESLNLYEPLPIQQQFHSCPARARLIRGSNRSGKTLSAAVELARAATGRDPFRKYPTVDGRAYIIGRDEKHLGEVIYRKLFRSGAFRIVRDLATHEWRAYRPWDPADRARKPETKPAPPLIPQRYVKSITWKSKGDNVPEKVILINGWEIDFFSSLGKPPRGSDLDIVWMDEEIVEGEWYPEMSARLLDRAGKMWWGATPQTGTDRLYELHLRCEAEYEEWVQKGLRPEDEPSAREFHILLADNPHIDEHEKRELAKDLNDQDHAVRIGGEFAVEQAKVFPEFVRGVHGLPYSGIPETWTRYAVVDPGRQVCAVLFAAVPPPDGRFLVGMDQAGNTTWEDVGGRNLVFLYDELYIHGCDAQRFGLSMKAKCQGQEFQAFIIDLHGSRIVDMGSGKSVVDQYAKALEDNGVACEDTGSRFKFGSDDVAGGIESVRSLLRVRADGRPGVLLVDPLNRMPNFVWEIERYRYKRDPNGPTDKPEDRGRVHLMACARYLSLYGPKYVVPRQGQRRPSGPYAAFLRKKERARRANREQGNGSIKLGPPR